MMCNFAYSRALVLFFSSFFLKRGIPSTQVEKRGIVGGYDTPLRPFYVGLKTLAGHCCGGTVITQWHVLTAAHCIKCEKTFFADTDTSNYYFKMFCVLLFLHSSNLKKKDEF